MRYRVEYETYTSKLATFLSLLKASFWIGFAFFFPIFNIPSFICLACGVDGATVGILFGVMSTVSIIAYILFCVFVKPDKVDDYIGRRQKKNTETNDVEQFFLSLYETAESVCPNGLWSIEFILYSLFKARIILVHLLTGAVANENTQHDVVYAFDTISLSTLKKHSSIPPVKLQSFYQTRIGAYDTVYSKHEQNAFSMSFLTDCLKWFLYNSAICIPNGNAPAMPYGTYYFPNKVSEAVFSEEQLRRIDELEIQTLNYLEKNLENFILSLTK